MLVSIRQTRIHGDPLFFVLNLSIGEYAQGFLHDQSYGTLHI